MPGFVTKLSAIHTKKPSHDKIKPVAIEWSLMGILLYLCCGSCYCQWMLEVKGCFGCIPRTRSGFTRLYSGIRRGYSAICKQIRQISHFDHTITHCRLKAYCAILVRRSNFRHQASPRESPRESTQRRKVELWARNVR
jgi:hypothetical protein